MSALERDGKMCAESGCSRPAVKGCIRCRECQRKRDYALLRKGSNAVVWRVRRQKSAAERVKALKGECESCGQPALPGHSHCYSCEHDLLTGKKVIENPAAL